mmetsp:Transcript_3445/g.8984  ORF Transcript_3445/g.8984 Transcript_3445/m.8984 type:complete len:212 (-) Transcript_3445:133-768(-)
MCIPIASALCSAKVRAYTSGDTCGCPLNSSCKALSSKGDGSAVYLPPKPIMSSISRLLGDWEARMSRQVGVPSADRFETRRRPGTFLSPLVLICSTAFEAKNSWGLLEVLRGTARSLHPNTNTLVLGTEQRAAREKAASRDTARQPHQPLPRTIRSYWVWPLTPDKSNAVWLLVALLFDMESQLQYLSPKPEVKRTRNLARTVSKLPPGSY